MNDPRKGSRSSFGKKSFVIRSRHLLSALLALLLGSLLCTCGRAPDRPETLVIAAASSMQYVLPDLVEQFRKTHVGEVEIVLGSTGQLTGQIANGAPYHVFLSAAPADAQFLFTARKAARPRHFAAGELVLWSQNPSLPLSLETLTDARVRTVALPDPHTAPYGLAARQSLDHCGLTDLPTVFGKSVGQTNQFITTGAADVGFSARATVAPAFPGGTVNYAPVPPEYYAPIQHAAAVLRPAAPHPAAAAFVDFLFTPPARVLLERYGYRTGP